MRFYNNGNNGWVTECLATEDKQEGTNPDESHTISGGLCQPAPVKTERMKQLELSCKTETSKMFAMESVEEGWPSPGWQRRRN